MSCCRSDTVIAARQGSLASEWQRFYDKPVAPFSWEPDEVEVLASATGSMPFAAVLFDPAPAFSGGFGVLDHQLHLGDAVVFIGVEPECDAGALAERGGMPEPNGVVTLAVALEQ